MPSSIQRVTSITTLAALLLGAIALPGTAAAGTRWVDDDGRAGPTTCNGTKVARKTIKGAITASAAGDLIKVCPGVYAGQLVFTGAKNGLTVRSMTPGGAKVRLPAAESGTIIDVANVTGLTLKGLAIQSPTGDACGGSRTGVSIASSTGVSLQKLSLRATGTATLTGCTLDTGITSSASATTISGGSIVDFSSDGVVAYSGGSLLVDGLSLTFAHAAESPATIANGINAQSGAAVTLRNVTIGGPATAGVSTSLLSKGIQDWAPGMVIENATISRVRTAIEVDNGDDVTVDGLSVSSSTTGVRLVAGSGGDISGVVTSDVTTGIKAEGLTGATIHDNTLTGASCVDNTSGSKTAGTGNTWTNNTAASSSPFGLCETPPM